MPFHKESSGVDELWTRKLYKALTLKQFISTKINLNEWIGEFKRLRKTCEMERIGKVLDWYCKHMGEEFVPKLRSANAFRIRFSDLVKAMDRNEPINAIKTIQEMTNRLQSNYDWPIEVQPTLAKIVQTSTDNWIKFTHLIEKEGLGKTLRDQDFLTYISHAEGPGFIEYKWMPTMHMLCFGHEHYFGDPLELAFKISSTRFKNNIWRTWSHDWSGHACAFDELLEELKAKSLSIS